MNNDEIITVQTYLRLKFQTNRPTLKRGAREDLHEMYMVDLNYDTLTRDGEEVE